MRASMNTKTVREYGIVEDVPLRRFMNDRTFIVALASPRRRNLAPRAAGMSSTSCSKEVICSTSCSQSTYRSEVCTTGHSTDRNTEIGPQPLEHRTG